MAQISGLWFSGSLRLWLEASSSIALRARAVSREVGQSVAAQERVDARIGRRCADIGRSKSQGTSRTVVPYTTGWQRPEVRNPKITASPQVQDARRLEHFGVTAAIASPINARRLRRRLRVVQQVVQMVCARYFGQSLLSTGAG